MLPTVGVVTSVIFDNGVAEALPRARAALAPGRISWAAVLDAVRGGLVMTGLRSPPRRYATWWAG
jgi:hypothetical protein